MNYKTIIFIIVATIAIITFTGEAYQYEHFDDGPPGFEEKKIAIKVSETLELGFRSQFHMTAYNWYFDTDASVATTVKLSGVKQEKNPKKEGRLTDNFVFNFTGVKASAAGQHDRLIFECYRVWEGKDKRENTVVLNVTVV